jgi:hypothetical protein
MVIRVLLVLAVLAVLYSCGQASSPTEKHEIGEDSNSRNGKISFVRGASIYEMNADGTGVSRVTDPSIDVFQAVMSPNREKIAFVPNGTSDLYTMNADGTDLTRVTKGYNDVPIGWHSE